MLTPMCHSVDPSKLIILFFFDTLWVYAALGSIPTNIVSNSHFVKRPLAREIICLSRFRSHGTEYMYFLIDEIFRTRPPSQLQGCFLVFYYCHAIEKSDLCVDFLKGFASFSDTPLQLRTQTQTEACGGGGGGGRGDGRDDDGSDGGRGDGDGGGAGRW